MNEDECGNPPITAEDIEEIERLENIRLYPGSDVCRFLAFYDEYLPAFDLRVDRADQYGVERGARAAGEER